MMYNVCADRSSVGAVWSNVLAFYIFREPIYPGHDDDGSLLPAIPSKTNFSS